MATPTDEQQLRATLRRHAKVNGAESAAELAMKAVADLFPEVELPLPPIAGAADVAEMLNMKATNLKRLSPPLPVAAVISGRIPVYRVSEANRAKARRDARRAA